MKIKLALVICAAFTLPFAAFAQTTDADYCKKLGTLASLYGANSGPLPAAVSRCDADAKGSIATLEMHLQGEKIKLSPC